MHNLSSTTTTTARSTPAADKKAARQAPGPRLHGHPAGTGKLANLAGSGSPLAQAIGRGDVEQVRVLLKQQATTIGYTAAHLAAVAGHAAALPLLQTAGENVHAATAAGDTPLLLAARHGHPDAVRFLAKSADLYHANKDGDSALTLAAAAGYTAIVQRLLVKGANVHHVNDTLDTALMAACRAGHVDVILALLASGACMTQANLAGETALSLANASGVGAAVSLLKARGATSQPSPESAALSKALDELQAHDERLPEQDQTHFVRVTVGEDLGQASGSGSTNLMLNAWLGDISALDLYVRHGVDVERVDNEGHTALMQAARFCQPGSIRLLLAAGARLDCRGRHGLTALHLAVSQPPYNPREQVATVSLLLDSGFDVDCRSDWGSTALHHAAGQGALAAVKLLLARGASLCASADGSTALHFAVYLGRQQVVRYLLDRGADPWQLDNQGENALDIALGRKEKATAALLRARGVKPARQ